MSGSFGFSIASVSFHGPLCGMVFFVFIAGGGGTNNTLDLL
jgi:hypothetical protein